MAGEIKSTTTRYIDGFYAFEIIPKHPIKIDGNTQITFGLVLTVQPGDILRLHSRTKYAKTPFTEDFTFRYSGFVNKFWIKGKRLYYQIEKRKAVRTRWFQLTPRYLHIAWHPTPAK